MVVIRMNLKFVRLEAEDHKLQHHGLLLPSFGCLHNFSSGASLQAFTNSETKDQHQSLDNGDFELRQSKFHWSLKTDLGLTDWVWTAGAKTTKSHFRGMRRILCILASIFGVLNVNRHLLCTSFEEEEVFKHFLKVILPYWAQRCTTPHAQLLVVFVNTNVT